MRAAGAAFLPCSCAAPAGPLLAPRSTCRQIRRCRKRSTAYEKETGMSSRDKVQRSILPIPDTQHVGVTTYDAKDPDTKFPPIEPLRPPKGAPNVLVVLLDDVGFAAIERVRWPDPHADRRAAGEGRSQVQSLPHDGAVLADPPGAADRPQSSFGEHGRHLRDRHLGAGLQLGAAEEQGAAGHDAQAQWLLDGAVRQVPRGAGLADQPARPVRPVADRRRRVRVLLRLHRRRDQPVVPGDLRRHDARSSRRRRPRRAITSPRT